MSQYVRRCVRCHLVRGISSFMKGGKGRTASMVLVCRTCREREVNRRKDIRVSERRIGMLRRTASDLHRQLETVCRKISRLERAVEAKRLELASDHDQSWGAA